MKTKANHDIPFTKKGVKKILLIMKLTLFLAFLTVFQVSATNIFSQAKSVSIDMQNVTVKDVIEEIEVQSGMNFFYNDELAELNTVLSITMLDKPTQEALESTLNQANMTYEVIKDDFVVLLPARVPVQDQPQAITGTVSDENGNPIPGVNIIIKGTTQGAISDADGNYTIHVDDPDVTLVFSFIGMLTQEVQVGNQTEINITMVADAIGIEEVVAIGYGTIRKSDLTGAVAKVEGETLQTRPVARVDQALQGQMSGVMVQQSGGKPGKNANIRIRGIGSITAGVNPLFVVDGFPVDSETFSNINLSDIESIEVLKDAASTAIYGSRGSNGVILVTTKRGQEGQELRLDIDAYTGFSNIEKRIPMMSSQEYFSYMADARDDKYIQLGGDLSIPPMERDFRLRYDPNMLNDPTIPTYDHYDAILQTGHSQSLALSASGASQNARYRISGGYFDENGIIINTGYTRYSFKSNIDMDVNKFLTLGLNLTSSYSISEDKDTEGSWGKVSTFILNNVPFLPSRHGYWGESDPFDLWFADHKIPDVLAKLEHLEDKQTKTQVMANIFAEAKLLPELTFKTSLGTNIFDVRRDRFEDQIMRKTQLPRGQYWESQGLNWLNENILNYTEVFNERHNVTAMLGFTVQKQENKSAYLIGSDFPNDYVSTLNAASTYNGNTYMSEWSLISYLARVNYSFSEKYLFSASFRTDGSSRFGPQNKWGRFPSVSGGWRIDRENFMEHVQFISQLKLRASWGKTGNNNIGDYSAIGIMGSSSYIFGANEDKTSGAQPANISNENLTWEKTATIDLGLDLGLFRNRLLLSADYYDSQTDDLLLNVPVPTFTGFSSAIKNYGEVENEGWDFELTSVNTKGVFKWTTNANLSLVKNTVKRMGPDNAPIYQGPWWAKVNLTEVGYPIGSYYMYKQLGVYNTQEEIDATPHVEGSRPGDIIIEDYNKDGIIDLNDKQIFGSNIPKYFFGITNSFSYKGFDAIIFLQGVGGNQIFDQTTRLFSRPQDSHKNHYECWANRWRSPEEPGDGMTPRASDQPTGASNEVTSRWLYDGDYIRLKNISLGYTFPQVLTKKLNISNLRIYLQGENIYTWDHFDFGHTPEVDLSNGNPTYAGNAYGTYPSKRTLLLGIDISF
ncbi:MAG: TonB-dependent receptor [Bacteroidota bacterium]